MKYKTLYLNNKITTPEEVEEVLSSGIIPYDINVVVMGEGLVEGEFDLPLVLSHPEMKIYAVCSDRKAVSKVGGVNSKINAGADYECVCRAASADVKVYFLPCASEYEVGVDDPVDYVKALAYVMRKHMADLKAIGKLDEVFLGIVNYAKSLGYEKDFSDTLNKYLSDEKEFKEIEKETNPILLISGDSTCYNVLQDFSNSLADALVDKNQAVITTNGRYGNYNDGEVLGNVDFKAVIGFQAPVLKRDFFKKLDCKKFIFWFDNPLFSPEEFEGLDDNYHFLCQDFDYAKQISDFYGLKNAIWLSPGGVSAGLQNNEDRPYDVVFIGSYYSHEKDVLRTADEASFYEFMLKHPKLSFEAGLKEYLIESGRWQQYKDDKEAFCKLLCDYHIVCRKVMHEIRGRVMSTILSTGINVDVFGDTWKAFDLPGKENLVFHSEVTPQESLDIWGHSKIGLNIMTWHKAGMTERIANIMMSGAVCLSDETTYLREHFEDGKNIELFELDKLDELPKKINMLLGDEALRKSLTKKAYDAAIAAHTWENKAKYILEILN